MMEKIPAGVKEERVRFAEPEAINKIMILLNEFDDNRKIAIAEFIISHYRFHGLGKIKFGK